MSCDKRGWYVKQLFSSTSSRCAFLILLLSWTSFQLTLIKRISDIDDGNGGCGAIEGERERSEWEEKVRIRIELTWVYKRHSLTHSHQSISIFIITSYDFCLFLSFEKKQQHLLTRLKQHVAVCFYCVIRVESIFIRDMEKWIKH